MMRKAAAAIARTAKKAVAKLDPSKCKDCAGDLSWRDLRYGSDHRCRGCTRKAERAVLRGTYVKTFSGPNRAQRRQLMKAVG